MKPAFNSFEPHHLGANWPAWTGGHGDEPARWLAYFDLLGFTKLVEGNIANAVDTYFKSREIIEYWVAKHPGIHLACFSDSYVLYADDDTARSFWPLEQAARWIMNEHLQKTLPLQGALSCGQFFADSADNVFMGKGYLEAHTFAEDQDWIGFVLCRSATKHLTALRLLPSRRLNYRRWKIPFKSHKKPQKKIGLKPLYAYAIGVSSPVSGENFYLESLRGMVADIKEQKVRRKYLNAIQFLEYFGVMLLVKSNS
jgi:hypothetical protein